MGDESDDEPHTTIAEKVTPDPQCRCGCGGPASCVHHVHCSQCKGTGKVCKKSNKPKADCPANHWGTGCGLKDCDKCYGTAQCMHCKAHIEDKDVPEDCESPKAGNGKHGWVGKVNCRCGENKWDGGNQNKNKGMFCYRCKRGQKTHSERCISILESGRKCTTDYCRDCLFNKIPSPNERGLRTEQLAAMYGGEFEKKLEKERQRTARIMRQDAARQKFHRDLQRQKFYKAHAKATTDKAHARQLALNAQTPSEHALERRRLMNRPKSHIVVLEQLLEEINRLNTTSS